MYVKTPNTHVMSFLELQCLFFYRVGQSSIFLSQSKYYGLMAIKPISINKKHAEMTHYTLKIRSLYKTMVMGSIPSKLQNLFFLFSSFVKIFKAEYTLQLENVFFYTCIITLSNIFPSKNLNLKFYFRKKNQMGIGAILFPHLLCN